MPDPFSASSNSLAEALAAALAPRYRVVSVAPRGDAPVQADAVDLMAVLRQFGFSASVLVGERVGAVSVTLLAAWYPDLVAALILVDATSHPPLEEGVRARALRDSPPDRTRLQAALRCPVLEVSADALDLNAVEAFLDGVDATVR